MKASEFKEVFALAESHPHLTEAEQVEASIALGGCAYDKRVATRLQCAYILNWQSMMLNGARDQNMMLETRGYFLKNVELLDGDSVFESFQKIIKERDDRIAQLEAEAIKLKKRASEEFTRANKYRDKFNGMWR